MDITEKVWSFIAEVAYVATVSIMVYHVYECTVPLVSSVWYNMDVNYGIYII